MVPKGPQQVWSAGQGRERRQERLLQTLTSLLVPPPPASEIAAGPQSFPKLAREPQVWPGDTAGVVAVEPAVDSMDIYGGREQGGDRSGQAYSQPSSCPQRVTHTQAAASALGKSRGLKRAPGRRTSSPLTY